MFFFRPTFSHSTRRAFLEESLYSHEDSSGLVHRSNLVLRTRKPGGLTRNNGINTGGVLLWKMWGYMWYSISSNVFFSRNLDSFLWTCSTHRVCNIHASSKWSFWLYRTPLWGSKWWFVYVCLVTVCFNPFFSDQGDIYCKFTQQTLTKQSRRLL